MLDHVLDAFVLASFAGLLCWTVWAWWHRRRTGQDVARCVGVVATWRTASTCPTCGAPVVGERRGYDSRLGPLHRERYTCAAAGPAHLDDTWPVRDRGGKDVAR
ncbi:hypothetical protein INN71_11510 [Nocardioides sp. ChNu-153]|uniref:hypothetical protein n=1 Tax=unclassified Nocardioides TaxID=2615069 RepID=UPI00240619AB|nr:MULTISPECIES: hypothetical protein [unclassified Nocardioides]MDF9716238.1 hypothetical protein [Nocardioides sp. ChNu-99]MDN7122020.1 hypothetical protein [Nocardioides sp. ChNu-153]